MPSKKFQGNDLQYMYTPWQPATSDRYAHVVIYVDHRGKFQPKC